MNVSLTKHQQNFISQRLGSGMYHSASEVIREGLRLLEEREQWKQTKLEKLEALLREGFESPKSEWSSDDVTEIQKLGREKLSETKK